MPLPAGTQSDLRNFEEELAAKIVDAIFPATTRKFWGQHAESHRAAIRNRYHELKRSMPNGEATWEARFEWVLREIRGYTAYLRGASTEPAAQPPPRAGRVVRVPAVGERVKDMLTSDEATVAAFRYDGGFFWLQVDGRGTRYARGHQHFEPVGPDPRWITITLPPGDAAGEGEEHGATVGEVS
jgi:hypothetical protein